MGKYVFLVLFVAVMIGVGIYSRKRVNDVGGFLLGNRKMGGWITAFAYGTSYFSAVVFIGYAGSMGWSFGAAAVWIGVANAVIGSLLAWIFLAKRTRKLTHELDAATMPDFFLKRYDSIVMKIVAAAIIFIFLIPYSASVYKGLGFVFSNTFGIPIEYLNLCLLFMAILTGIYLLLGGYLATALNDFIQGIIMIAGVLLVVYFVVNNPIVGGVGEGLAKLNAIDPGLTSIFSGSPINLLSLVLLTSLGTWGLPQMVHKFYTIRDESAIKKGTIISTVFSLIIGFGAYFCGAFGRIYLNNQVPADMDMIMPVVFETALPDLLLGLLVVLMLSASMSTLSSLVLVSSSSVVMDLLGDIMFPNMKKNTQMLLMRVMCAFFVALSYIVSTTPNAIVTLMSFSWGTIAGTFLGPFIYGLYWKSVTKVGAWGGFIAGFMTSIAGTLYYNLNAKMAPNIGVASMIVSLVAVPVVTLVEKAIAGRKLVETTKAAEQ